MYPEAGPDIFTFITKWCMYKFMLLLLQDNNGTIENEELRGFLKDLLELVKKVSTHIYTGSRKVKRKLKYNILLKYIH
jgi:hypothetical protein